MLRRSLVAPSGNFTYIDYINNPASAVQIEAHTHPQGHFLLLAPSFSFVRFLTAVGQAAITSRAKTNTRTLVYSVETSAPRRRARDTGADMQQIAQGTLQNGVN